MARSSDSRVTRNNFSRSGEYLADRNGKRGVAKVAVQLHSEIHRQNVAFAQLTRGRRNPVHDFLVDRRAHRARDIPGNL